MVGPLVTALPYESSVRSYPLPFTVIAVIAVLPLVLPLVTRMPAASRDRVGQ